MTSSFNKNQQLQPETRALSGSLIMDGVQAPDTSGPNNKYSGQEQERKERLWARNHLQDVPLGSSSSATSTEENEEMAITNIRATDLSLGLGRIPAGFYVVVHHNGVEWRTETKRSSVHDDTIEWDELIPISSDLSVIVCLEVYASFEFQPVLGNGLRLRKLTISVTQLMDCSMNNVPFLFFPKEGEVISPCSSISVAVKLRKWSTSDSSISRLLATRCLITQSRGELEEATDKGHDALSLYQTRGGYQNLERSIREFEHALSTCPLDHPCRAAAQTNLAIAKFINCQAKDTETSLEEPLALYRCALAGRPVGHLDRPSTLLQLAMVHLERQGDEVEMVRAQALSHEALMLETAERHEDRATIAGYWQRAGRIMKSIQAGGQPFVEQLSIACSTNGGPWISGVRSLHRFKQSGDLADLQQAISLLGDSLRFASVRDHRYLAGLLNLGAALSDRFHHLGELCDLEEAISRKMDTVKLMPHGHPDRSNGLDSLGSSFLTRFDNLGEPSDLEEGISRLRDVNDLTSPSHPDKPRCLSNLGNSLLTRFDHLGELCDIEEAISTHKKAVDLTPHHHPQHPARLNGLGTSFLARFERFGQLDDLEEAISRFRDAVDLIPHGHPEKSNYLNNLGCSFLTRFDNLGELSDLEEAASRLKDADDITPRDHPLKARRLSNLGNCFRARFDRLGELGDLQEMISRFRDVDDLIPHNHPDRPGCLGNLGNSLLIRFHHFGEESDLEEAILKFKCAKNLTPRGHLDRPRSLNGIGDSFLTRFDRFGELSDLEEAISRLSDANTLITHDHPRKPTVLHNLGICFLFRFHHSRELNDLQDAISMFRDANNLTPPDHPSKPGRLNNLAHSFLSCFGHSREVGHLEEAISRFRDANDLTPRGHPDKPGRLNNLAKALIPRFRRFREPSDLEEAISLYSYCASTSTGLITIRFSASQDWILCARHIHHHSLLHAYSVAIGLLPQLAWTGLPLTQRYHELIRGADVVREAAAAALDLGLLETAVEFLEQGRSIVWGELYQLRSPYEDLSSVHPDHARRLQELSIALERAGAVHEKFLSSPLEQATSTKARTTESLQRVADKHHMLAIERNRLLQEIRKLPGFERFLLHKEFSQLRASAHSGPVVLLNAAESRCDALIVLTDVEHVIHVPLPNFTFQRSAGLQNMLKDLLGHARAIPSDERVGNRATRGSVSWESLLSILWTSVVKPVLNALAISTPGDLSRIFWCPTGPFVFLPIHAAGLYGTEYSQPGHKVHDFVVSSYVPTLSILAPSPNGDMTSTNYLRLLAVPQPLSDGQTRLPGVAKELDYIKSLTGNSPSTRVTLLESSVGTVEEVLTLMSEADWVHFACHGIQDATHRTDSGLCLADQRRLKISDIIALSRPRGGLAFLSACQTAMGDEDLSDEAIHIAAGMLFAGYGGVIGTMWSISDNLAPRVARDVYGQLFRSGSQPDHREAARALHNAVGCLRDSGASFMEWLPFIHVGL